MIEPGLQLVLDTSILEHYVRLSATWDVIRNRFNLFVHEPVPTISIVTEGELRALALRRRWGENRIRQLEYALSCFPAVPLDRRIVLRYASLDYSLHQTGRKLGKNDIWIASTASVDDATVLTTDCDFLRFSDAILNVEWVQPEKGRR